ncbi:uncharacterized, partial [Tachysurus ichikawai]
TRVVSVSLAVALIVLTEASLRPGRSTLLTELQICTEETSEGVETRWNKNMEEKKSESKDRNFY